MADERIRVIVEPDTSGFARELTTDLKRVNVDYEVDVHADTTPAEQEVKSAATRIKATDADLNVGADTAPAQAEVAALSKQIAKPITKIVNAAVAPALKQIAAFTTAASKPIVKSVTLVTTGAIKSLNALQVHANKVFSSIAARGRTALGVAAGTILGAAILGKDELIEADRVSRQTIGTLKLQGKQAQFTVKQIENLSQALLKKNGIDDQVIQSGINQLLMNGRFNQIVSKQPAALRKFAQASLDLGDKLKSPEAGFKAINKVLADPVKGMNLLTKQGVIFSDQTRKQVKELSEQGKQMQAVDLVMKDLRKTTGGLGTEFGKSIEARANRAGEAIAGIGASILSGLLPFILPLAEKVQKAFETGQVEKFIRSFSPLVDAVKVAAAAFAEGFSGSGAKKPLDFLNLIQEVAVAVADEIKNLAPVAELLGRISRAILDFIDKSDTAKKGIAFFALFAALAKPIMFFGRILIFVGKIVGRFIGIVVKVVQKLMPAIKFIVKAFTSVGKAVIPRLVQFGKFIGSIFGKIGQLVMKIGPQLLKFFSFIGRIITTVVPHILRFAAAFGRIVMFGVRVISIIARVIAIIGAVVGAIGAIPVLIAVAIGVAIGVIIHFREQIWDAMKRAGAAFVGLLKKGTAVLAKIVLIFVLAWKRIRAAVMTAAMNVILFIASVPGKIYNKLSSLAVRLYQIAANAFGRFRAAVIEKATAALNWIRGFRDKIFNVFSGAAGWLYDKGQAVIGGLFKGLKAGWEKIADWLSSLKDKIIKLKGPPEVDSGILVDNGKRIMSGLWDGMKDRWSPIDSWLGGIAGSVKGWFDSDGFNAKAAQIMAGNSNWDQGAAQAQFGNIGSLLGLHRSSGWADTLSMVRIIEKAFQVGMTSGLRPGAITASGNVSDHSWGGAADFGTSRATISALDRLATEMSKLVGSIMNQVIWRNSLWRGGKSGFGFVGGHMDHAHLGWLPRRHGGRVVDGSNYIVGETGPEPFFPDRPGMIMSHARFNRLLALGNRVDAIERMIGGRTAGTVAMAGPQKVINFEPHVTLEHKQADPNSIMAILNTRLDVLARTVAVGMAT